MEYDILLTDVPYRVMVHLVRHKIGVEYFVATSRDDRTDNVTPQAQQTKDEPCTMQISINAQALISISNMRLCNLAMKETREVWEAVRKEMEKVDPVMASQMVPRCVRYHGCPEITPCRMKVNNKYYEAY